jgi:hypothetical protein
MEYSLKLMVVMMKRNDFTAIVSSSVYKLKSKAYFVLPKPIVDICFLGLSLQLPSTRSGNPLALISLPPKPHVP